MKPSNILVFSLSMGVLINVKISDYGISQYAGVMGLNAPVGTPGHQAPEVTQGDSEYNLEVSNRKIETCIFFQKVFSSFCYYIVMVLLDVPWVSHCCKCTHTFQKSLEVSLEMFIAFNLVVV